MPRLLHSVIVQEQNIAADGIYNFDLPVNPLSVILIGLRPLNDTGSTADFASYYAVAQALNRITVYNRGAAAFSMRGEDAAALAYFRHGIMPYQCQHNDTNNERRCSPLPILMGRHAYDPKSCFPASRRGEMNLELDIDIADTGYDTLNLSVETIELLDAHPSEYERKISVNTTFAATGFNDVELAPGNMCRGLLLWGTAGFTGASPAPTWGRISTLVDNVETGYSATDFEMAASLHCLWGRQPPAYDLHKHRTTVDGNAQTGVTSLVGPFNVGSGGLASEWARYAYLDFDPIGDDTYTLDLRKAQRFVVRANAEGAAAVRAIPIEVIKGPFN